ncbi:hypothetical protein BC828DRAFT_391975, partial [Blastocladiella britannica]
LDTAALIPSVAANPTVGLMESVESSRYRCHYHASDSGCPLAIAIVACVVGSQRWTPARAGTQSNTRTSPRLLDEIVGDLDGRCTQARFVVDRGRCRQVRGTERVRERNMRLQNAGPANAFVVNPRVHCCRNSLWHERARCKYPVHICASRVDCEPLVPGLVEHDKRCAVIAAGVKELLDNRFILVDKHRARVEAE